MQASANSLALLRSSHVMNELLETERAYVEELLCVLEVSVPRVSSCLYGTFTNEIIEKSYTSVFLYMVTRGLDPSHHWEDDGLMNP